MNVDHILTTRAGDVEFSVLDVHIHVLHARVRDDAVANLLDRLHERHAAQVGVQGDHHLDRPRVVASIVERIAARGLVPFTRMSMSSCDMIVKLSSPPSPRSVYASMSAVLHQNACSRKIVDSAHGERVRGRGAVVDQAGCRHPRHRRRPPTSRPPAPRFVKLIGSQRIDLHVARHRRGTGREFDRVRAQRRWPSPTCRYRPVR